MPLLQTFPPHEDESGLGYYRRLSAANALWNWRELASMAEVSRYKTGLFANPEFVASQLDLQPEWTRQASRQDEKSRALHRMHRQRYDAVCPCCLDEELYLRQSWEHALITACPKHECLLIEQCTACGGWLSPEREHIELCPCGNDLRTCATQKAKPTPLWLSCLLSGEASTALRPTIARAEPSAVAGLVKLLCQYANPAAPTIHRNASLPSSVQAAQEFLAPLDSLLEHWPQGFEEHVKARIDAGRASARTVNSLLGHWLRELRKCAEHPPLKPFLDITLDVCQKHFNGRLGSQDQTTAPAEQNFKRLAEAAKQIGVSRDILIKAIVQGECAYRTMRYGTKGETCEVSVAEIARIQELRKAWVGEMAACNELGVTPGVLQAMAAAAIIEMDRDWRGNIFKAGAFHQPSLAQLQEALKNFSTPDKADGETVAWSALTSRRMGDKTAIAAAMKAAFLGEIRAVKVGKKVGDYALLLSDVRRYFGTPLLESGMSISQLAKATGWKDESISHWINQRLLDAEQIQLRGQPCRVITPEQLLRFRRTYMPLADLAKAMGTKSSSLIDKLADVDLVGAKKLPNGAQRGALIRMADLGKWAVAGLQVSRGGLFKLQDYA